MSKKTLWSRLFGEMAEGKTATEISQMALDAVEALGEEEAPKEEETKDEEAAEEVKDEDYSQRLFESIDALGAKLDALCDALMPKEEEPKDEDPIEAALKTIEEAVAPDSEEARVVPAEELDGCQDCGSMDVKSILTAMRPVIAEIKDDAQRKAVADALVNAVAKPANDVNKIVEALPQMSAPKAQNKVDIDEIQRTYDQLNPHTRKETK